MPIKKEKIRRRPLSFLLNGLRADRARQFFNHVRHLRTKSRQEGNSEYNHGMTSIVLTPGESRCGLSLSQPCCCGPTLAINPLKGLDLTEGQTFGFPSAGLGFP